MDQLAGATGGFGGKFFLLQYEYPVSGGGAGLGHATSMNSATDDDEVEDIVHASALIISPTEKVSIKRAPRRNRRRATAGLSTS